MKGLFSFLLCLCFLSLKSQVIITESFEKDEFPPEGWKILNGGQGNDWRQSNDPTLVERPYSNHSGNGSMVYEYSQSDPANAWAITPKAALTADVTYSISFYYRVRSSSFPEKLRVTVGVNNTIEGQSTVLWDNNGGSQLANAGWRQGLIYFTPSSSENFYFGFNCYSDVNQFAISIDDIKVEVTPPAAPGCTTNSQPVNGATGISTSPALQWNAVQHADSYDVYIDSVNPPRTLVTNVSQSSARLTGAQYNTTYYWYVVPRNGAGPAAGCSSSATAFTTGAPPPPPSCTILLTPAEGSVTTSDTANFSWRKAANATAYTLLLSKNNPPTDTLGSTRDTSFTYGGLEFNTTYYWTVLPQNDGGWPSSCSVATFTTPPPPPIPACSSTILPADSELNVNDTTTFTWSKVEGATGYALIVGRVNPPVDTLVKITDTTATISLEPNTQYYWFAAPYNKGGVATNCVVQSFRTEMPPPAPFCTQLVSPANGATNVSSSPTTFIWRKVANAIEYLYLRGLNPTGLDTLGVTTDTSLNFALDFGTTYYWSIVPVNSGGYASGCGVDSFTTVAAPPPPANDNCDNAVQVLFSGTDLIGSTYSATQSRPAEQCGTLPDGNANTGDANDDIWYKFTSPASGDVTITVTPDGTFDPVIVGYSGSCTNLAMLSCADEQVDGMTENLIIPSVVAGQTYYFRVYGWSPQGSEGTFTVKASLSGTLPVTISLFKAERVATNNLLSWSTETEQNNAGFEIQRSGDGRYYGTLAFIPSKAANGTSTHTLMYQYADDAPLAGQNYYRLKQIDQNGKFSYSQIAMVAGFTPSAITFNSLYPNPSQNYIRLLISSPRQAAVSYIISDLAGRMVMQKAGALTRGVNNISLDIQNLSPGQYFIKMLSADGLRVVTKKFVKQ